MIVCVYYSLLSHQYSYQVGENSVTTINEALRIIGNVISGMRWSDVVDILIITFIIYKLLSFVRKTSASGIIKGIVLIIVVLWLSEAFNFTIVSWLLGKTMELGVIAIIILFQPEIRNFLTTTGSSLGNVFERKHGKEQIDIVIEATVTACTQLSKTRTGALIVFQRNVQLEEYMKSGTVMNSVPSVDLFLQIFYPNTPLHDGALIIADGYIGAAGCMLPMSANTNLSRELGMRHRAGIGITEHSDAISIIVSEETGAISVAVDGMLKRHLTPGTFEMLLKNELIPEKISFKQRVMDKVKRKDAERKA